MTPQERKVFEQALEALEREARGYSVHDELQIPRSMRDAITAIKEVLAQSKQEPTRSQKMRDAGHTRRPKTWDKEKEQEQEPVAWLSKGGKGIWFHEPDASLNATPLYTTPPPRKPLTDEHIGVIAIKSQDGISPHDDTLRFARAIEAAHGIKE